MKRGTHPTSFLEMGPFCNFWAAHLCNSVDLVLPSPTCNQQIPELWTYTWEGPTPLLAPYLWHGETCFLQIYRSWEISILNRPLYKSRCIICLVFMQRLVAQNRRLRMWVYKSLCMNTRQMMQSDVIHIKVYYICDLDQLTLEGHLETLWT